MSTCCQSTQDQDQNAVEQTSERPTVSSIFKIFGPVYRQKHPVSPQQMNVMLDIEACRTSTKKRHLQHCPECGYTIYQYNSCGNRHCPTCQNLAEAKWIAGRSSKILPVKHFQVVFTLPEELRPLALHNQRIVYELLLTAAGETLNRLAQQTLHARLGISSVLHTWTRDLRYHPHVHCLVGSGGISHDEKTWVPTKKKYLFPIPLMRSLLRSLILKGLLQAYTSGNLTFKGTCKAHSDPIGFDILLKSMWKKTWVVHVKRPIGRVEHVLKYLARYINRVAISDYRIMHIGENFVRIRTKGIQKVTLSVEEFIRRFLLHVLPEKFHKIRHTGLYSPYDVCNRLEFVRTLVPKEQKTTAINDPNSILSAKTWQEIYQILTGEPALLCPMCNRARMVIIQSQSMEVFIPHCPVAVDRDSS